jgi:N-acetylmuramoyl-L-alanine amidase
MEYQFSPAADGSIYNTPSADSVRAAQEAFNGGGTVGAATYFFNPDLTSAGWIVNNKTYVTRIGDHVFYR